MIFKKLELKNFKSHEDTTIEFNQGITLIVGNNGAGKSSIFEAISFALFKPQNNKVSKFVRTNKGNGNKFEMEVKLTFEDVEEYRVERKVILTKNKKKSTEDSIKFDTKSESRFFRVSNDGEELIDDSNKGVDEKIKEKLSMDSTTFFNAIHVKQGEISSLIDKSPGERKKLIGQLLGLEKLEKAYTDILEVLNVFELKEAELKGKKKDEDELNSQLEELNQKKLDLNEENNKMKEELKLLDEKIDLKNKKKEELDILKSAYETLNLKLDHENQNLKSLNKQNDDLLSKYNEILENEEEMKILEPFTKKLSVYNEFKESLFRLNNLKDDEERYNQTLNQIETYRNTISEEKENHEKYVCLEKEIKELNEKRVQLSTDITHIDEFKSNKKTLEGNIDGYHKDLEDFYNFSRDILSSIDSEYEIKEIKTNNDFDNLNSFVESLIIKIQDESNQLSDKVQSLNNESIRLNQEINSLKEPLSEIEKVDNKCPVCQSDISEDKKNELIDMYNSTISSNNKKINENNGIIEKLNDKKSLKDSQLEDLHSIKNKIYQNRHLVVDLERDNGTIESINTKIKDLQGKKEELDSLEKIIVNKNEELTRLEPHYKDYLDAETLLKATPKESEIKDELSTIINKISDENKQLKECLILEDELSLDIPEEDLNNSIDELTKKENRYHILLGTTQDKGEYEEKLKDNSNAIKRKTDEIEEIRKDIDTSDYNEKTYNEAIILLEDLKNKSNQYSQEIAVNDKELENFANEILQLEESIRINNDVIRELKDHKRYLAMLKDFRKLYHKDGIQKDLRGYSRPLIEEYTREFFEKFNFEYSDLSLDDEYNISISGEGVGNTEMASGGEKIALALALRLGITQVMSEGNIETILLDEPTIHLDSYRRQELINILHSISIIPQMLIVTHDSELENAADTVIKVEKENGVSKVEIES